MRKQEIGEATIEDFLAQKEHIKCLSISRPSGKKTLCGAYPIWSLKGLDNLCQKVQEDYQKEISSPDFDEFDEPDARTIRYVVVDNNTLYFCKEGAPA
jgi:hypothetical protein